MIHIDPKMCKSCKICIDACPKQVLAISNNVNRKGFNYVEAAKPDDCISCGICAKICPDFVFCIEK